MGTSISILHFLIIARVLLKNFIGLDQSEVTTSLSMGFERIGPVCHCTCRLMQAPDSFSAWIQIFLLVRPSHLSLMMPHSLHCRISHFKIADSVVNHLTLIHHRFSDHKLWALLILFKTISYAQYKVQMVGSKDAQMTLMTHDNPTNQASFDFCAKQGRKFEFDYNLYFCRSQLKMSFIKGTIL